MHSKPYRFLLLLVPGFSHLALPLVTEPLFVANWLAGRPLFGWRTCSGDGLAVATSSGAAVAVDAPLGTDDQADAVLVLASFDVRQAEGDARPLAWLRRMARTAEMIGGIETGSEVLAAAGLLQGRRVAVHWYNIDGFRARHPHALPQVRPMLIDGPIASSAGALATVDLMLALIARQAGATLADEVARHLHAAPAAALPLQAASPLPAPGDPLVRRALSLIHDRLGEPRDGQALARDLGLSPRQLQRRFGASLGQTVGETWREAQFARAHQLVQQTDMLLTDIAFAVGFGSLEAFSRAYRRRFGVMPSRDRAQSTHSSAFGPPAARLV